MMIRTMMILQMVVMMVVLTGTVELVRQVI